MHIGTQSAVVISIAILFSLAQAASSAAQHSGMDLPPLALVTPTNGATVSGPVIVIFQTPADLSKMTMGAHVKEGPHVHVDLDKRVTMPTIKQLTKVGTDRYQYTLGKVRSGKHSIRLYWANRNHKPLGPIQTVSINVK